MTPVPRAAPAAPVASGDAPGPIVATYDVAYDARAGTLAVDAAFEAGTGGVFTVDRGAEAFVKDVVAGGARGERRGAAFEIPACARAACRVRYTFALRAAARALDDVDLASERSSRRRRRCGCSLRRARSARRASASV